MTIWAILGTLSIPGLIAIYFFRNRYPKKMVSSLLLWEFPEVKMRMGNKKKNFIAERSFWFELISLLLFLFILYEILIPAFQTQHKTIFILDSRYSLQAISENNKSVRQNIIDEIIQSSAKQNYISIIVADQIPELLIVNCNERKEIENALQNWQPVSMNFDWQLTKIMMLELADINTKMVIYSDRVLSDETSLTNCELRLRGKSSSNYAFISGAFTKSEGKGNLQMLARGVMLKDDKAVEVLNAEIKYGDKVLLIPAQKDDKNYYRFQVQLDSFEKPVDITLKINDSLSDDNSLHFEPPPLRYLNIGLNFSDPNTFALINKTLKVFDDIKIQNQNCHLIISDNLDKNLKIPQIIIGLPNNMSSNSSKDVFGEIIIQKSHPFLRDVCPQNVRWRTCYQLNEMHEAYLYQNDIPLFGRLINFEKDVFFLNMNINKSDFRNLQDWPIFWDNIRQYFLKNVDGIKYTTVFGDTNNYIHTSLEEVEVITPRKKSLKLNTVNQVIELPPFSLRGLYQVKNKENLIEKFYVNYFDLYSLNLTLNENSNKVIQSNNLNNSRKIKQSGNSHFFILIVLLAAITIYCISLFLDYKEAKTT